MKSFGMWMFPIALLAVLVFALPAFPAMSEETVVAETIKAWDKAYKDADMATLASLLTDDAVIESAALKKTVNKVEYLEKTEKDLKSNSNSRSFRVLELKVTVNGDRAETVRKTEITVKGSFSSPNRGVAWIGIYVTENKLRLEGSVWKIYFAKTYLVS